MFLLSSSSEGLPTVVLEAICCELPIISTQVGSIEEAVDKTNGILVENYNHNQMINAIHLIAGNDDLRSELSKGSKLKKSIFYLESCLNKHIEAYEGAGDN
jgi:glycosyltransferase involved in cell wall biosynthesis